MNVWMKDGKRFSNPLVADGRRIYNPSAAELSAAGWTLTSIEPPAPAPRTVYTKLQIRRAMRALNMEETLDAMIDSSDIFAKDWHDAQEIDLNDPVMVQALAASGVTEEQIAAIRTQIEQ